MRKYINRYTFGIGGTCLVLISFLGAWSAIWPTVRTGAIFMLVVGGIGMSLVAISTFLPWKWE